MNQSSARQQSKRKSIRLLIAAALFLFVGSIFFSACHDNSDSNPAPTITAFSPMSGAVGTTVTITGTNFSTTASNNAVTFNGMSATVTASTSTSIATLVPTGATSGKIAITIGSNSVTSTSDFTVTTASTSLSITSFAPSSGVVGTSVTIVGTAFSTTAASNAVKFNGTTATVSAATATTLTVTVPTGATTGKIALTAGSATVTSATDFTITTSSGSAPTITSFSPTSGAIGSTVTITGTNFSTTAANNTVTVNGTAATINTAAATQITITVPTAATTGPIAVTVNTSSTTATSSSDFTVTGSTACSGTNVEQVVCLANAFLATLSTSQQASVTIAYTKANAIRWSNLPCGLSCRNGVLFSSLTSTQLAAAKAVIQAASGTTTDEGYSEFSQINAADDVLAASAGGSYGSGNYVIAFLGAPTTTGTWMMQFGGHHYAQNITYSAGVVTSATPSHQGLEPKSWTDANSVVHAPLAQEHDGMAAMLASFTTTELASAKISGTFSDCLMVPGSTTNTMPATKQGVQVSTLSAAAQAKVLAAMAPWLQDLDDAAYAAFTTAYSDELANTYVAYASNTAGTSGDASTFFITNTDYVRIDGPSVWIEFICQTGVVYQNQIHYHSVMRDHSRDYIGL